MKHNKIKVYIIILHPKIVIHSWQDVDLTEPFWNKYINSFCKLDLFIATTEKLFVIKWSSLHQLRSTPEVSITKRFCNKFTHSILDIVSSLLTFFFCTAKGSSLPKRVRKCGSSWDWLMGGFFLSLTIRWDIYGTSIID